MKDVSANDFIAAYALYLKKNDKIQQAKWTEFVKTSTAKELAPVSEDWLYIRAAAVARRVYLTGHKGVTQLSHMMGGNKRWGTRRNKHSSCGSKIIRFCLQELERIGVVKKDKKHDLKKKSRVISSQGQADLNQIATQVAQKARA